MNFKTVKTLAAEFLSTYIFIFVVCANGLTNIGIPTAALSAGVSTAFVAVAVIYSFGGLSGAHFNPAVTISAMVAGKIDPALGCMYVVLQILAAIFAVATLSILFPDPSIPDKLLLTPAPNTNIFSVILFEFILTFILVFVIFATAMGVKTTVSESDLESQEEQEAQIKANKQRLNFAPLAIGLTLGFLCFLAGSVTGGAFNPARATAPAVLSLNFSSLYLYWVGDVLGGIAAALLHTHFFAKN